MSTVIRFIRPEYARAMRQEFLARLNRQLPMYHSDAIQAGVEAAMDSWKHGNSDDTALCDGVDRAMFAQLHPDPQAA